ncbi:MAG: hypothetical protein EXX96DRAFT_478020 [Benjaminiella poitrasii]|nr:MAG: hypothetical protein EXX96DRAFT_478020 [Benjaminiella poitrasii]
MEVDQQTETISANDATTSGPVCSSCGQEDHLRATSRLCANSKHSNIHNIVRKGTPSFTERHDLGGMNNICRHCQARMWASEKNGGTIANPDFSLCCGKGKYVVDPLPEIPEFIVNLLRESDAESKEFRSNLRAYNSALTFTSLGCNLDSTVANARVGAYSFRIHGSLYHRIGTLHPGEGEKPKFAQIYIHDFGNEIHWKKNAILSDTPTELNVKVETARELYYIAARCYNMHDFEKYLQELKEYLTKPNNFKNGGNGCVAYLEE